MFLMPVVFSGEGTLLTHPNSVFTTISTPSSTTRIVLIATKTLIVYKPTNLYIPPYQTSPRSSSQYPSSWLSFIAPRVEQTSITRRTIVTIPPCLEVFITIISYSCLDPIHNAKILSQTYKPSAEQQHQGLVSRITPK